MVKKILLNAITFHLII